MLKTRTEEQLTADALAVIDEAVTLGRPERMAPLYSGGYDSLAACLVASQHPLFDGHVHHINTSIGSQATRNHVEEVCGIMKWKLIVYKSKESYEKFVRERGFPGPGRHQWAYNRLKDRCVYQITNRQRVLLITGCRSQESTRRMGHVEPVKIGETSKNTGKVRSRNRIWTAPCHDWSKADQLHFLRGWGLPSNPVKESALRMSGECFCGAFALASVRHHSQRLTRRSNGKKTHLVP